MVLYHLPTSSNGHISSIRSPKGSQNSMESVSLSCYFCKMEQFALSPPLWANTTLSVGAREGLLPAGRVWRYTERMSPSRPEPQQVPSWIQIWTCHFSAQKPLIILLPPGCSHIKSPSFSHPVSSQLPSHQFWALSRCARWTAPYTPFPG